MKCVQIFGKNKIVRVTDDQAQKMVSGREGAYVAKHRFKAQQNTDH